MNSLNARSILVGHDISSTEDSLQNISLVMSGHQIISEKVIALKSDLVVSKGLESVGGVSGSHNDQ